MKMIFKAVQLIALIFTCLSVQAKQIKPLKIGDRVPDIFLAKMLNHKTSSGKLSDFKGKAIIIDQWFIACAPCVGGMRHMDSLQRKFSSQLQVLPVTFEKKGAVEEFWKNNVIVKGLNFSQVVEDTIVRAHFPAVSFPQQIWIDNRGYVVAITDGSTTTAENVRKLINGEKLELALKKDELDMNVRHANDPNMVIRYNENKDKVLFYSYFSKYRKEFSGLASSEVDSSLNQVRVICNNASLFRLYDFAYANNSWEPRNLNSRFIRRDSKSIKGTVETRADTIFQFCYDLIYPGKSVESFGKFMITDLDRFFDLKSYEEEIEVDCFVVSPNGNGMKYKEKYQPDRKQYQTVDLNQSKRIIANDAWPWLLAPAINGRSNILFLFELPKTKRINFDVRWTPENLNIMNADLSKFDLKIEKTKRKRKVIILEDR